VDYQHRDWALGIGNGLETAVGLSNSDRTFHDGDGSQLVGKLGSETMAHGATIRHPSGIDALAVYGPLGFKIPQEAANIIHII